MPRKQYELTFILGETADQKIGEAKTKEVTDLITQYKGEVSKQELWGRRELAYIIKKNRSGFYITLWFDIDSDQVKKLEQQLLFDESIIRSLITAAYTTAQPGTLYPVSESEETESTGKSHRGNKDEDDATSAEEMIRRSGTKTKKKSADESALEDLPEEERRKLVDESLEELLGDKEESDEKTEDDKDEK